MSDTDWVLVAQSIEVQPYLRACRLLGISVQTRNDDQLLLVRPSGLELLNRVRQASTRGWIRGVPLDALAHCYKADPIKFEKILACIHVAIGLGDGGVEDIVKDLLKIGEDVADE
jgi:hypothetical protein